MLLFTEKDLSVGFATAADVARTAQGDCTEHAVLLAALLRASDIPQPDCQWPVLCRSVPQSDWVGSATTCGPRPGCPARNDTAGRWGRSRCDTQAAQFSMRRTSR